MGKRRKAREKVLMSLYRMDMSGERLEGILKSALGESQDEIDPFTEELIKKISVHLQEIDEIIGKITENWEFQRIAIIDRNILRFAICELLYFEEIPTKVTIDEAIEIAKKYSTEESGRFVNGILDRAAKEINLK
ncbi:transcription antitermination factor NusB [candidate division TA06 bacterium]|nr:transcription antitermination factor NusB [candidate division TA06 bacterium]